MARKADNNEYMDQGDYEQLGVESNDSSSNNNSNNNKPQSNTQNKQRNNSQQNRNHNNQGNRKNNNRKRNNNQNHNKNNQHRNNKPSNPPKENNSTIPTLAGWSDEVDEKNKVQEEVQQTRERLKNVDAREVLKNIKVDLNSIEIFSDLDYDIKKENTNFLLNNSPTYEVKLSQSAFVAHMQSLKFSEVNTITQSVGSDYNTFLAKYQLYFNKINSNSLGINKFEDFKRLTSLYDVSTLEFGIYNITFPGSTEFSITCKNCEETMKNVKVDNSQLIAVRDDELFERLDKNIGSITDIETANKYSLLSKRERIMLEDSKFIMEIKIPTVEDHLSILGALNRDMDEDTRKRVEELTIILIHIDKILMPSISHLEETGELKYISYSVKDGSTYSDILDIVSNLELNDSNILIDAITEQAEKYSVGYAIQSFPCRNCGEDVGDIDIDISQLIFRKALR